MKLDSLERLKFNDFGELTYLAKLKTFKLYAIKTFHDSPNFDPIPSFDYL